MAVQQIRCTATVKCFVEGRIREPGEEFIFTGDPARLPKHVEKVDGRKRRSVDPATAEAEE